MKIIDETGRIGVVTEKRENGFFAKPIDQPYIKRSKKFTLITATFFHKELSGCWFDDPLNTVRKITIF